MNQGTNDTGRYDKPVRKKAAARRTLRIMTGILISTNLLIGMLGEYSPQIKDPTYGDKWRKLQRQINERPNDPLVLSLGSSRTLLGFHGLHSQKECHAHNGKPIIAFNFGTPAAGPITQLIYLRRLLSEGVKPTLLLIEVMPGLCAEGPNGPLEQQTLTGERLKHEELTIIERYGFNQTDARGAWRESALIPVWKLRFQLLGRVVPSWIPWNLRYDWSRGTDSLGWATPPRQETTVEERKEREEKAKMEYSAALATLAKNTKGVDAIRAMLDECRNHRIEARLILYPEGTSFKRMYTNESTRVFLETLRKIAEKFHAPLIDARDWLPDEDMYDGHHMFSVGAKKLTQRLTHETIIPYIRAKS